MSEPHLTLLPATAFVSLVPDLKRHLALVAESISGLNFSALLDTHMKRMISDAFEKINASEGSVWICDSKQEYLMVAYNTGPHANKEIAHFKQPLTSGIVSMAFASEQSFLENDVYKNSQHDKTLDSKLSVKTHAMIVTPLYYLAGCRGVISCVQIEGPQNGLVPWGFNEHDLAAVRHTAAVLGRLVDAKILRAVVGLG